MITPREASIAATRPSDLLSRRDVAMRFGVAPQTITRWANEGIIPCVRTLGGQRRYPAYEVERLLSAVWEHGVPGTGPAFLIREHQETTERK